MEILGLLFFVTGSGDPEKNINSFAHNAGQCGKISVNHSAPIT